MSRRSIRVVLVAVLLSLGTGFIPATSLPSLRHVAVGVLTLSSGDDVTIVASSGYGEDTGFARVNGDEMILSCLVITERETVPLHELWAVGRSLDTGTTWRIHIRQSTIGGSASVSDTPGVGPCSAESSTYVFDGVFFAGP